MPASGLAPLGSAAGIFGKAIADDANVIGSPLKKARPSLGADAGLGGLGGDAGSSTTAAAGFPPALGDVLAKAEAAQASQSQGGAAQEMKMEEEEL
jgi:hypothetical protein